MSGGIVIDVLDPDYQLRLDIVKFKSEQMGLEIDEKTSQFLAEKITSSGREIEGCLKRLLMHQKFMNVKIGNHSHPEMIWDARNLPQPALLKFMILYTLDGCLRESLEVPKGSQATCSV